MGTTTVLPPGAKPEVSASENTIAETTSALAKNTKSSSPIAKKTNPKPGE